MVGFGCYLLLVITVQPLFVFSTTHNFHHVDHVSKEIITGRDLEKEQIKTHEIHCSRERSRAAWEIIDKYLMPFVERERYRIPQSCRFHSDNDLFREQEQHKIQLDERDWQCGYCKKAFSSEEYLDKHLESRHYNLLNFSQGKCLADLCGALHCDHFRSPKSSRTKCNPAAAGRNRHLCESLADTCFPLSQGPSSSRLHELFLQQFCEAHSCLGGRKPFSRGGRKETSVLYIAGSILTLMLLPLFYILVFLHQSETRRDTQELRRIPRPGRKAKSS